MDGWGKIRQCAKYSGVSERTMRVWLHQGLNHSRLPSGTILIRYSAVDKFLEGFEVNENTIDRVVEEVCKDLG